MFALSFLCEKLRLPAVIGFLLAGLFLGPLWHTEAVVILGDIGLVLLFFLLGVDFPVSRLGSMISRVWPAGVMDIIFNFLITSLIAWLFNLPPIVALLVGAICYASSSSIILKMLEDTRRIANPETEFIVGLLVFEDLLAPIMVAVLTVLLATEKGVTAGLAATTARMVLLIAAAVTTSLLIGRTRDLLENRLQDANLALFLLALGTLYAGVSLFWGISEVLGAFLAGIMIAEAEQKEEIERLITPVRDVSLPLYFLAFAATIDPRGSVIGLWLMAAVAAWSVAGKILVATWGGKQYGLGIRPRWRAGFSLVARGEFSIVLASLATGWLQTWAGLYIVVTAFTGVFLLQVAPVLVQKFFPSGRPYSTQHSKG